MAVHVLHPATWNCGDALAGNEDAGEIERVGCGDLDRVRAIARPGAAKRFDCIG
jgi:hypothetical protein